MEEELIREEFRKAVILGCHPDCDNYKEAVEKEFPLDVNIDQLSCDDGDIDEIVADMLYPITIGRVMKALAHGYMLDRENDYVYIISVRNLGEKEHFIKDDIIIHTKWKLTNEDGRECTAEDQTLQTIEELLKLLQK